MPWSQSICRTVLSFSGSIPSYNMRRVIPVIGASETPLAVYISYGCSFRNYPGCVPVIICVHEWKYRERKSGHAISTQPNPVVSNSNLEFDEAWWRACSRLGVIFSGMDVKYKTVAERPRHNPDKTPVQFFRREASISAVMVSGIEAALHSPFPPAPRIIS